MKKPLLFLTVIVLAIGMLYGCGPADDKATEGEKESEKESEKTLTIALSNNAANLDFATTNAMADWDTTRQISEGLLRRDMDTFELQPALATEWQALDENTWQFKLREDVVFHNGEPFNAEAVKFSIERYFDEELESVHRAAIAKIGAVEVVDEFTVNIILDEPFPLLFARLAATIVMFPPKYIEEHGNDYFAQNPVGTGPYKFKEWVTGEYVLLEANPDYWRGSPVYDFVDIKFITEPSTRVAALLSGDVDVIQSVAPDDVERIQNTEGYEVVFTPHGGQVTSLQVYTNFPSMENRNVRLALALAIDMETILKTVGRGYAVERAVPVDSAAFGYNPNLEPYGYDPERAKELLAEAGYGDGLVLDLNISEGRYMADRPIMEAMAEYLNQVGVTANLNVIESSALVPMWRDKTSGPINQISWTWTMLDVTVLFSAFHEDSTFGTITYNEEFTNVVREAEKEMDPERRKKLWWRAQEIMHEEVAYLSAWQPQMMYGAKTEVNWPPHGDMFTVFDVIQE